MNDASDASSAFALPVALRESVRRRKNKRMDERRAKMKADFEKSKSKLFNIKKEKKEN